MTWIDRLEQLRREQNPSRSAPKRERPALRIPAPPPYSRSEDAAPQTDDSSALVDFNIVL
mgnify:FL=1